MAEANGTEADRADELDAFLEEIGGSGGKVKLYRKNPDHGRMEYVTTYGPDVDLETVQETYGGGAFQFRAYRFTPDGQDYVGARTVHIAGAPRELGRKMKEEDQDERLERLREERDELRRELEGQRLEQRFESFRQEIIGLVRELRQPPPQAEQENPIRLAMELARQMNAHVRPHIETPPRESPDVLEIIKLGMELGAGAGGGGEASGYERVLERFAPAINRLLGAGDGGRQPMTIPNPPPAAGGGQPMDLRQALGMWVPYLAGWAQQGKAPEARALAVWDELPPLWQTELDEFLEDQGGSAITTILGWYPELAPHRAWLSAFLDALQPEPEEDATASDGPGGRPIVGTYHQEEEDEHEDREDTA